MSSCFLIAALASTVLAGAANAATFFTDAGAFGAATSGLTHGNFTGIANVISFTSAPSFTVAGVTFDSAGVDFVIDGGLFSGAYYGGAPYYSSQGSPKTTISFGPITAFGMFFGSYTQASEGISFTLSDAGVFNTVLPGSRGTATFFGFTSAVPITSISVNFQSQNPVFDAPLCRNRRAGRC